MQKLRITSKVADSTDKQFTDRHRIYCFPDSTTSSKITCLCTVMKQCAKDKRVPNATITPELFNLSELDLGPEDAMQFDLLPNLPPSGGIEIVLTVFDVFPRYMFVYPLTDASAINVAKVLLDIVTKLAYIPTTLITVKGTAFTSTIIAEFTQISRITLKSATTKHPQTIGK